MINLAAPVVYTSNRSSELWSSREHHPAGFSEKPTFCWNSFSELVQRCLRSSFRPKRPLIESMLHDQQQQLVNVVIAFKRWLSSSEKGEGEDKDDEDGCCCYYSYYYYYYFFFLSQSIYLLWRIENWLTDRCRASCYRATRLNNHSLTPGVSLPCLHKHHLLIGCNLRWKLMLHC